MAGFGYSRALAGASADELRVIADRPARLVELIEGEPLDEPRLVAMILRSRSPIEVLRDTEARRIILSRLPQPPAVELRGALGAAADADLAALTFERGSEEEKILLRFLGVLELATRPPLRETRDATITPAYGLFEHQRNAVTRVLAALIDGPRAAVLHLPTGAGKTRCAMHVVARRLVEQEPTIVVWLAYSSELLEQAAEEFEAAWTRLGNRPVGVVRYWSSGTADILDTRDGIVIAGLGKLHARLISNPNEVVALADRTTLVVVDEAHQSIAPTYRELIELLHTKRRDNSLLGLTATPGRTWADIEADRQLSKFFGGRKVTLEIPGYTDPVAYLIAEGYLAHPSFSTLNGGAGLTLDEDDLAELASDLDVPQSVLDALADDETRNLRIVTKVEELVGDHRRIIVFAASVRHARLLGAVLAARGIQSGVVTSETSPSERARLIDRFRSNDAVPMVLVNYGVLTTGFDAPATSAVVIARPTRSLVLYSQMVGRAIRGPKAGGNETCEVVTVVDPDLPGFGDVAEAFTNWEDVWQ